MHIFLNWIQEKKSIGNTIGTKKSSGYSPWKDSVPKREMRAASYTYVWQPLINHFPTAVTLLKEEAAQWIGKMQGPFYNSLNE